MRSEPFIQDRNAVSIWIEPLFGRHEVSSIFALVLVSIADRTALHHEIPKHSRILFFGFLQPKRKAQSLFSRHLSVGIGLCHRATVQQKRTPSAVPSRRCFQIPAPERNQLMKLSLACPFPLCQFLEPRQVSPCVFDIARNPISDELKNELHAFQRWIEAHQEERIELRLKCVRVDDLEVALPIVDLGLRERMEHHQVKSSLVLGYLPAVACLLNRKEVFVERN